MKLNSPTSPRPLVAAIFTLLFACNESAERMELAASPNGGASVDPALGDAIPPGSTHNFVFADSPLRYHGQLLMQVAAWREGDGINYRLVIDLNYTVPLDVVVGDDAVSYGGLQCILTAEQAEALFGGETIEACTGVSVLNYFIDEQAASTGIHIQRDARRLQSISRTGTDVALTFLLGPAAQSEDQEPTTFSALGPLSVGCSVADAPMGDGPTVSPLEDSGWNSEECRAVAAALQIEDLLP